MLIAYYHELGSDKTKLAFNTLQDARVRLAKIMVIAADYSVHIAS